MRHERVDVDLRNVAAEVRLAVVGVVEKRPESHGLNDAESVHLEPAVIRLVARARNVRRCYNMNERRGCERSWTRPCVGTSRTPSATGTEPQK